jgi:hypothetical protein
MPMPIATRSTLNATGCDEPGCTHDHSVLWLCSLCHPTEGLEVAYEKATGVLTVTCKVCETLVARILVGDSN